MANERTYLAWLRTSANVMVLGLVIAKFAGRSGMSLAAGAELIGISIVGLVFATWRHHAVTGQINRNQFVTGSRGHAPVVASGVLICGVVAALALLMVGHVH